MERGPLALFGAVVAVGLGPALWLGAQFGNLDMTPTRPPGLTSVTDTDTAPGGAGAADNETTADLGPGPGPRVTTRYAPSPTAVPTRRITVNRVDDDVPADPTGSATAASSAPASASAPSASAATPNSGTDVEAPAAEPSDNDGQAEDSALSRATTGMVR